MYTTVSLVRLHVKKNYWLGCVHAVRLNTE